MVATLRSRSLTALVVCLAVVAGAAVLTGATVAAGTDETAEKPLLELEATEVTVDSLSVDVVATQSIGPSPVAIEFDPSVLSVEAVTEPDGSDGDFELDHGDERRSTVRLDEVATGDPAAGGLLASIELTVVDQGETTITFDANETTLTGPSGETREGPLVGLVVRSNETGVSTHPEPTPAPIGPPGDEPGQGQASFELADLTAAESIPIGEPLAASVAVTNVGETTETAFVEFGLDDHSIDVVSVEVGAGESSTAGTDEPAVDVGPGTYELTADVGDARASTSLTITDPDENGSTGTDGGDGGDDDTDGIPGFGLAMAAVAGLLSIAIVCRDRISGQ